MLLAVCAGSLGAYTKTGAQDALWSTGVTLVMLPSDIKSLLDHSTFY